MEEKEVTLTKPAAGTNSVNAPTGEKVSNVYFIQVQFLSHCCQLQERAVDDHTCLSLWTCWMLDTCPVDQSPTRSTPFSLVQFTQRSPKFCFIQPLQKQHMNNRKPEHQKYWFRSAPEIRKPPQSITERKIFRSAPENDPLYTK